MSEFDQHIRCSRHGSTWPTFVCGHAARGEGGTGAAFHFDPSPDDPWPDAWCDRCEEIFQRDGGWNDENGKLADLTALCGSCWEDCYERAAAVPEIPEADVAERASQALARIRARQRAMIAKTELERYPRYHYDQQTRAFELRSASEVPGWRARFLIAGSWAAQSQSWLWGWANDSLARSCTSDLVPLKRSGEELGIKRLWRAFQKTTQPDAETRWILAADALNAEGIYACRDPESTLYLLLFDLTPVH